MIERSEIDRKAEEFDIHTSHVQRDYVHGWLLAAIYSSDLREQLTLKGGNCLRKAYFERIRYSQDLDFSAQSAVSEDALGEAFRKVSERVTASCGVEFDVERMKIGKKKRVPESVDAYEVRLYFQDFYGTESSIIISVRLDIKQFDRVFLPVQERYLIHPYSDADSCRVQVRCLKLEEVLASKLKCLLQRRHSVDLYDYVFWLMFGDFIEVNRGEILRTFLSMTIFDRNPAVARGLLIELPFTILKALWERYVVCPLLGRIAFDEAVDRFRNHIADLFGQYQDRGPVPAFFPANLRNIIMDAGFDQVLLKLRYAGVNRLIEPYALTYKRRKDGVAQEYFYGWDQTGGTDSGPGIKTFLHHRVEALERTDDKFEPRFEIELSKAGERSKDAYFGRSFDRGRKLRAAWGSHTVARRKRNYVVRCYVCGREFRRMSAGSRLRPHKDTYGNRCYGRSGAYRYDPEI